MSEGNVPIDYNLKKKTSVGNVIRFRKRRIMTKCRSLHLCLLDPPIFQCRFQVFRLPRLTGKLYRVNDFIIPF